MAAFCKSGKTILNQHLLWWLLHVICLHWYPVFFCCYAQVSDKFAFSLFDLDWDVFSAHIEGACNRVPVIAETGVKSTVCGPESFTADHKPLMGEAPELRGFFHGCGFNSSGIMLAGGCGRELAHWVVNGHPQLDMYGYDIRWEAPRVTNINFLITMLVHD